MADNTTLDPGTGGDTIRDKDRAGIKTPIVALDLNPAGAETLMAGAMPVTDNGGSLTVDGTVGVSGTVTVDSELTTADLDTGAGTDTRAVVGLVKAASGGGVLVSDANPLPVADGGGSLTVDGTVTANAGTGPWPVTDNGGSLTVDNAGTFAVQDSEKVADNATFTDGTTKVLPAGFVLDEVAGTALTENDAAAARVDSKRSQIFVIEDETTRGQRATVTAGKALKVDGSAVTQPVDTELPAAAALADATANPTIPSVAALGLLFNGTTWDRVRGDTANGVDVDVTRLPALVAGSALIGRVNLDPQTANGLTIFHLVSAATTNATNVKASAGQLYGWYIYNSNAAARKVAFHNTAGAPTAGASVAFAVVIPPSSAANVEFTMGIPFATGIAITTVTGLADSDATAVAANDLIINLFYK